MPSKYTLAVAFATLSWSVLAGAQRPDPLPALEAKIGLLQSKIATLESIRGIKRLQYAYGHYVELGLWNDFADLFTDDAVTNYQQGARGKAQVRQLFFQQVGQGKLGLAEGRIYPHILFQPVITLGPDGKTAKGRWRILAMLGGYGGSATWYSGVYENEYVFEGGAWKISVLRSEPKATAAYTATGWKDSGVHIPFHYTSASVSAGASPSSSATKATTTTSLASLSGRMYQLAERATRLSNQAEVTNLQDKYGYAFDRKQWDQVAELFAKDGTLELGLRGVYAGKASIRHALDQFGPPRLREEELNDHVYLQTVVSVAPNGRTAQARGVELIMANTPDGKNGELSEGTFENTFVKERDGWKIQSVHFYPRMIVDPALGWAKSARPAPGPSKEFPPDRPPTAFYEIYPKFSVAPFHFDNPVTGKPPQYPEGTVAVRPIPPRVVDPTPSTIHNAVELAGRLADIERSIVSAEGYEAAENLINAYGYYTDKSPAANGAWPDDAAALFTSGARQPEAGAPQVIRVMQLSQPVIQLSRDGQTAKIRARLLELGGYANGKGSWASGVFDGEALLQEGFWKFKALDLERRWGAAYPGGWARTR